MNPPDFLSAPRIKDLALLRVLKISCDECSISGVTEGLHLHHVILKSSGGGHRGDDVRENIICISEPIHTLYHRGDPPTRLLVATHISTERPDIVNYIAKKLGSQDAMLEWFNRHGLREE